MIIKVFQRVKSYHKANFQFSNESKSVFNYFKSKNETLFKEALKIKPKQ